MIANVLRRSWDWLAGVRFRYRAPLKTVLFYTVVLIVFYPNPLLLVQQIRYWAAPETLISTDFPALADINRDLAGLLPAPCPPAVEYDAVQKYVCGRIRGMSDIDNWGVLDCSPDPQTVWERGRGDCEDRAILAVSILRARGHRDAQLVGNLVHMWVQVDTQELLGPMPDRTYQGEAALQPALPAGHTLQLAAAGMLAGFPAERAMIIVLALLALSYHPRRDLPGFLACLLPAVAGYAMLREWSAAFIRDGHTGVWLPAGGLLLMAIALLAALFPQRGRGGDK